jgi:hypothetical protein
VVDHARSSLISAGLAETLFFFFEVKDGYDYEFSYSDLGADTAGAVLAVLLDNFSRLDEMFDYRVQYFPSREYVNNVSGENFYRRLNIAEDYSGETYLIAFHPASIHALRDARYGTWSRFVDVAIGFESRGYKPSPPMGYPTTAHHQDLFLAISFNAQGFFEWLLKDHPSSAARTTRYITHGVFEIFRVSHLLANKRCVVTESAGYDTSLKEFATRACAGARYEKLAETCRHLVDDEEERRAQAERGYMEFKKIDLVENVRQALELV